MSNEELVVLIQAGERDKIPELWAQVKGLVWKHAMRWDYAFEGRNGATIEDYMQAGFIGLLYAVDYYKPDCGAKFSTILCKCIKTPFSDTAGIRTSKQLRVDSHWISLDAPSTADENSDPLEELIADPNGEEYFLGVERCECHNALEDALATLTEEQRRVIKMRYYNELDPACIAKRMNLNSREVQKLEQAGIRKLRAPAISKNLRTFM